MKEVMLFPAALLRLSVARARFDRGCVACGALGQKPVPIIKWLRDGCEQGYQEVHKLAGVFARCVAWLIDPRDEPRKLRAKARPVAVRGDAGSLDAVGR
jgi:hypothetical protein